MTGLPRWLMLIAAAVSALLLGGCALMKLRSPDGSSATATRAVTAIATSSRAEVPSITHNEVATPPGPAEHAPPSVSPEAALRRFCLAYINWDAADLRERLRGLAADSVGQARTEMTLAASQTGADPELTQAGVANHGTVEAIAALPGANRYVVVTRESTTATDSSQYAGLAPAWHLTVATVARRSGGWVISGWQPET